ncbi:transcription factor e2f8 [Limosa lapponica baueri]|uniref:Transcription factor e2f8 n=1 Tax=Limosa lapponica baueri TaxID=1758121 RepID=A0A2I0T1S7_LIMLA|nr:transcription factor e2f8 [Limosa lapponica baueri]
MNHEPDHFQEERQNKTEALDQNVASCSDQCKREDVPEDEGKIKTKQDVPVAFAIPAHEPCVPKEPQVPQTATENFFRTPGGPNTVPSPSANSDGTNRISPGTLYIPQRKLEVAED